jgi:hypothetical protein
MNFFDQPTAEQLDEMLSRAPSRIHYLEGKGTLSTGIVSRCVPALTLERQERRRADIVRFLIEGAPKKFTIYQVHRALRIARTVANNDLQDLAKQKKIGSERAINTLTKRVAWLYFS